MQNVSWTLTKMSDESQKFKIINLRKKCFAGEDVDKENVDFWDWEFKNNYADEAHIYLAVDNDKVVGHYAICPSTIMVDGEEKNGSIVVDVMTDPDYRYQGMFTQIGQYSLTDVSAHGVEFSYGFPIRKTVMPGHIKVGWKVAFPLPVYIYPTDFYQLFRRFLKSRVISWILSIIPSVFYRFKEIVSCKNSDVRVEVTTHFEETDELKQLLGKINSQHKVIQKRDYRFLDWRFNQNTYRNYQVLLARKHEGELTGYAVIRESEIFDVNCLILMDIHTIDFDVSTMKALINCVIELAHQKGTALVGCMINDNWYKKSMLKHLFIRAPYVFKMIIHKNCDMDYMSKLMKNKNWYLTWTDTDDL